VNLIQHRKLAAAFVLIAGIATLCAVSGLQAQAPDAMAEVKATVDQVLSVVKDPNYKASTGERRQKLREIIGSHFDFTAMSRSALGTHWKDLSEQQRQEFTDLFTRLMEASYMGKIESYNNQQIDYQREISEGPQYAQVNTQITQAGQEPVSVNYRLRQDAGTWKVYDVIINGISLVANYRNQFNRIMNSKGYDALIESLKAKQSQLDTAQ
jgi:phospholipid transport system substrate-binding protein